MSDMVWVEDRDWKVGGDGYKCRRPKCPNRAVAALWRVSSKRKSWWRYCGEHLYGRRIHDGQVQTALPSDSPAVERGFTGRGWSE